MANKYLVSEKNVLIKDRLEKLSKRLIEARNLKDMQTNEQILTETIKMLTSFYKDLTAPIFDPSLVVDSDLPDPSFYNEAFKTLMDDLSVIFAELENTETLSVANFNFSSTETNKLFSRLKSVSSKLNDYVLYVSDPRKEGLYFIDSFSNSTKIDSNSPLLNELQCNVNQDEGIVTLPVNKEKTLIINIEETPIINSSSNGFEGNNQEVDSIGDPVAKHDNLNLVLDSNPDTWFEYEKVVEQAEDINESLVLDLTINLGEIQIINYIKINPNNFGTATAIKIKEIETAVDGDADTFLSIKKDIPIAGFTSEDEENVFILAPATSKYSGQGIYTFTPRKAKYVHLVFEQTESYPISTVEGLKNRYAIGIRDIDISSVVFKPKGEIISNEFTSLNEVKKMLLESSQNPTTYSELVAIDFSISSDNGQSWNPIQSKSFLGQSGVKSEIPELLNFNTLVEGSVSTPVPVKSLRIKSVLSRNDENFTESKAFSLNYITSLKTELHSIPLESPFSFQLGKIPLDGMVSLSQPFFGSTGDGATKYEFKSQGGAQEFYLFDREKEEGKPLIPRPWAKTPRETDPVVYETGVAEINDFIHVHVAGEEWTYITKTFSEYSANYSTDDEFKVYKIDLEKGILSFGSGKQTTSPPENSIIGIYFDAEKLSFEKTGDLHFSELNFKAGLDKDALTLKLYYPEISESKILSRNMTVLLLGRKNITDISGLESFFGVSNKKTFINGKEELLSSSDWSVDIEEGIVYTYTPTSAIQDTLVFYRYQLIETLDSNDWDWDVYDSGKTLYIKEGSWKTFPKVNLALPSVTGSTVFHLAHLNIVKDSFIKFDLTSSSDISDSDNLFGQEIDYIDGSEEFGGDEVVKKSEHITEVENKAYYRQFAPLGGFVRVFVLSEKIVEDISYPLTFAFSIPKAVLQQDEVVESISSNAQIGSILSPSKPSFRGTPMVSSKKSKPSHKPIKISIDPAAGYFKSRGVADYISSFTEIEVDSSFSAVGQYKVYRDPDSSDYLEVHLVMSGTSLVPEDVTYIPAGTAFADVQYYIPDNPNRSDLNLYSVDYKLGIVHTEKPMSSDWSLRVTYEYSDYRAYYQIANPIVDFKVDIPNRIVTISDKQILSRYSLPEQRAALYYQVDYSYAEKLRTDIPELKDYFTPVLKAYELKMITDKDLF